MNVVGMDIEVVKKKIKNMHLSVLPPDGKVRVSVPLSISEGAIELFVISKIGWIKKTGCKISTTASSDRARVCVRRKSLLFWCALQVRYSVYKW